MKRTLSQLLLIAYLVPSICFAQPVDSERINRIERGLLPAVLIKGDPAFSIAERMKFYKVPGLSVAVINNFQVEWARGYGVKDLETKEAVSTETLFQAGSISKSVNAAVAMKKVEQGRISLDENINDKLTTWKLPENELTAKNKVTLRRLLSHTAGTTVHGFPGYAVTEKVPTVPQVLDGAAPANTAPVRVDLEPGTKFRYSGGGTTITQLALMDLEKKPYPEIARQTVLGPLNMTNSTYSQPLPSDWLKKAATGYRQSGVQVEGKIHIYPEMAAAGLWTTPTDLAKFGIELQLTLAGKSNKLLSKQTVETMTSAVLESAGLGFFVEKHGQALYFGHGGADEGFRAEMLVSRDKGYGAVVMCNSDNGQILREVIRSIAKEYGWDEFLPAPFEVISLDAAKLEAYSGRFKVNPDRVLTIANENGKLMSKPTGDPAFELLPISEGTFIRRDSSLKYEFLRSGAGGPVESLQIVQGGNSLSAKRISASELVPFELLQSGKFDKAINGYRQIKKDQPDNISVSEDRINNLGYSLLRQNKIEESIALLKLNVEFYPKAWNTYDSLAEAYMTTGKKDLAIANYRKSLELNPENGNGRAMLKKLEGQ
jgi:CubicO group peptidase (beta-lactamase class C family)